MSSTKRGNRRAVSDYYITPIEEIVKFLKEFNKIAYLEGSHVLDCCAGGDPENPMSYPEALANYNLQYLHTIDIREDSRASTIGNYLDMELPYKPDIIMTNPPFVHALDIIKKALDDVEDQGWVVMLCRLNFFGSDKRKPFWDTKMPDYVFVHSKRMSFTQDGKKDSIEYAHFCWKKGSNPKFSQLMVI